MEFDIEEETTCHSAPLRGPWLGHSSEVVLTFTSIETFIQCQDK